MNRFLTNMPISGVLLATTIALFLGCSGGEDSGSPLSCDVGYQNIDGVCEPIDADGDREDTDLCAGSDCGTHATCDPTSGQCVCDEGYEPLGSGCVAVAPDGDDPDGDDPDGDDPDGDDPDGDDPDGDDPDGDDPDGDDPRPPCPVPQAPAMPILPIGAVLSFHVEGDTPIEIGTQQGKSTDTPASWTEKSTITLENAGLMTIFARTQDEDCRPLPFRYAYDVRETFPPAAGQPDSSAITKDDPAIIGWANSVENITFGTEVDAEWKDSDQALGAAEGSSTTIVSLGRGGLITLGFASSIKNGDGADLAVFENSFNDTFLELAFVEVSSDGETFLRFDNAYLGETAIAAYGTHNPTLFDGLAGKYRRGFGTPFDLSSLSNRPEVLDGSVDLDNISYVRIVDIVGDGTAFDSFGHVIYDPYPTIGSAGFDLDAVAALN